MRHLILIFIFGLTAFSAIGQSFNLINNKEGKKHAVYVQYGYDYSFSSQFGYAYKPNDKPYLFTLNISLPEGSNLLDDHKVQLGGQVRVLNYRNYFLSAEIYAVLRRHETKLVKLNNFGQKSSFQVGYSRSNWNISAEVGLDNAFMTKIENKQSLIDSYPGISNGWVYATGKNAFYGLNCEFRLAKKLNMYCRIGGTNTLNKNLNAIIPYYFNIGLAYSI